LLGIAKRILITDKQRGADFVAKFEQVMAGIWAQHESYATPLEVAGDVGDALLQELKVAQVGVGIEGHRGEEDHHGFGEGVGGEHCRIEGGVVAAALRALHPVDDASAVAVGRAGAADVGARI
jgi:hypothetical protein